PRRQARARDPQVEAHAGRGAHLAARRAESREVRGALQARHPDPGAPARGLGQARTRVENQSARNLSAGLQSYPATTISPPGCRTTATAPAIVLGPEAMRVTMPPVPKPGSRLPLPPYLSKASRSPIPASAFPATTILLSDCTATAKPLSNAPML